MPHVYGEEIDARGLALGIVVSMFNEQVTRPMLNGAIETAHELGVADEDISVYWVAGAFELPLIAQRLAESGQVDAVAAIGCVIRGETPHFDFVAGETARGLMNVTLESAIPVALGVTTTDTLAQAEARAGGAVGNKGSEAAYAALHSAALMRLIGDDEDIDGLEDSPEANDEERG